MLVAKLVLGAAIGAAIGGLVGHAGKCSGGTCPLTCKPTSGAVFGAILGVLVASSLGSKGTKPAFAPSPHVAEITGEEQLADVLRSHMVLVDFYADWCGACRQLKPTIHQIADEYVGRANVVTVNVDNVPALARRYGVEGIPDVRIFRDGKPVATIVGVQPRATYTEWLDSRPGPAEAAPEAGER